MNRLILTIAVLATLLGALDAEAQRRRAVKRAPPEESIVSPAPPGMGMAWIRGIVRDASSGIPIAGAGVEIVGKTGIISTDAEGKFELYVETGVEIVLLITRAGYDPLRYTVGPVYADGLRNVILQRTEPARIRMTDGREYRVDGNTMEFGYIVPFAGYNRDRRLNMCREDGTPFTPDRTQLKRIGGPSKAERVSVCCSQRNVQTLLIELRSGEKRTAALTDSCDGYSVDLLAIESASGQALFLKFSEIAEVVFP